MVRVLLADDHEAIRRGVRQIIEERPGWTVCGEAPDGRQVVEMAVELAPDVVVLDVGMPGLNGLETARRIRRLVPSAEILIFTVHDTDEHIRQAVEAGAKGFVLKSDSGAMVLAAIEALAAHKPFLAPAASETILRSYMEGRNRLGAQRSILSPREQEVIQLVAEGRTSKEIATLLALSVKTVEAHRSAVMRKLGARSVAELVRYAVRNRIVSL